MSAGSAARMNLQKWKLHLLEGIDEPGVVPVQWSFCPVYRHIVLVAGTVSRPVSCNASEGVSGVRFRNSLPREFLELPYSLYRLIGP